MSLGERNPYVQHECVGKLEVCLYRGATETTNIAPRTESLTMINKQNVECKKRDKDQDRRNKP